MSQKPFVYQPDEGGASQFSVSITKINRKPIAKTIIVLLMNRHNDSANPHKVLDAHYGWCAYKGSGNTNQTVATCNHELPLSLPVGHILHWRNHLAEARQVGGAFGPVWMHR